ncbi:hypothetical protein B5P45_09725 [Phyllobacterium zundukense]|uniref:Uncharacterized protein n=1 Tax=Phyllobacterium zundukense TaxID=1867719 RepID=A0A2N9W001_9HYPH|nr:hypothetical protein BLM14_22270 [Phyllobacterium zundukense]PIO45069.1 hypothetical protein B5P45_09725 [Phyllobacterium zundukense]
MKTLGQAARQGMLVQVMCRKCEKTGFFVASDLATVNGHGRTFRSLKFRCRECDVVDCEAIPFEDDRDRVNKKRIVWRPVHE